MIDSPVLLIPNVAAEEGAVWRAAQGERAVRGVVRLWRLLFADDAVLLGSGEAPLASEWPDALGVARPGAAFQRLDAPGGAFAWLNTREAADEVAALGRELAGAPPEVVMRVHDKAFALDVAAREDLVPPALRGTVEIFEPEDLRGNADAVVRRIEARVAAYPDWLGGDFALKPRLGSSGRGRVAGRSSDIDTPELRGALERLAARGGAVLEPWLRRGHDLSAQLFIGPEGVVLLGTLELVVSPAGLYRGHRGTLDSKGRVTSGLPEDEALREAALAVALAAREAGYHGPCGLDAFTFAGPDDAPVFRPVVEWNARFTMGTVVIGLLRRALPHLRQLLRLRPEVQHPFEFWLDTPDAGWPAAVERSGGRMLPLFDERHKTRPGLLFGP